MISLRSLIERVWLFGELDVPLIDSIILDKADSDALYKLNPSIPRFFSFERVILTYILYVTGLLPFFPI